MITLYAAGTPNGRKITIALAELDLPYTLHVVKLAQQEQKQAWFLRLNPNGKIPVLTDDNLTLFESGAILIYLAQKAQSNLYPREIPQQMAVLSWLMWQMSGLGPMMGQLSHFTLHASEKVPYAISRYRQEVERLLEVLNQQLAGHDYVTAYGYSIADIALYPWVQMHDRLGLSLEHWPHIARWLQHLGNRAKLQAGMQAL